MPVYTHTQGVSLRPTNSKTLLLHTAMHSCHSEREKNHPQNMNLYKLQTCILKIQEQKLAREKAAAGLHSKLCY